MLDKVLFIDDDSVALMLNKILVGKTLFAKETLTALNGEEALQYYKKALADPQERHPELVFLDLNMPVMDGWDFLEEFQKPAYSKFADTKIIVLSSSINPEDLKRSKEYHMVMDFVSKPVTIETLEQLLQVMEK